MSHDPSEINLICWFTDSKLLKVNVCVCIYIYNSIFSDTLKSILINVPYRSNSKSKPWAFSTLQNQAGFFPEGSVLVHEDVNRSSLLLVAVEVERSSNNQVVPARTTHNHTNDMLCLNDHCLFYSFNKEGEPCHLEAFSRVSVDMLKHEAQQDHCKVSRGKLDMLWSTCFEFAFKLSEVWHRSVSVMIMDFWVWKQWYWQVTPIVTKLCKQYYVFLYTVMHWTPSTFLVQT